MKVYWLLFLFVAGCISGPTFTYTTFPRINQPRQYINVCIDRTFDSEDKATIISAIDEWDRTLNGSMVFTTNDVSCNWTIIKSEVELYNEQREPILAQANYVGGTTITVIRTKIRSEWQLKAIMLHEIGHLLGANHMDDSLMNSHYSIKLYPCIDQKTIQVISKYQGLSYSNYNFCTRRN